jgi:RHS repeat-associated protein
MVNAGNVDCAQAGAPTTEIAYIQADHLNTPRTVTNSQQQVIWKWDQQDPFGANVPSQDPDGDGKVYTLNLRFPGQYFDAETGLSYNYYRDYDPQTGRYVQSDPIGLKGGVNTYAYVAQDPVSSADPLGLEGEVTPELPTTPTGEPIQFELVTPLPVPPPTTPPSISEVVAAAAGRAAASAARGVTGLIYLICPPPPPPPTGPTGSSSPRG